MKLIAYFNGKINELNALMGIDSEDFDDIYYSSTDDELESMGAHEEALEKERNPLPPSFSQYAI